MSLQYRYPALNRKFNRCNRQAGLTLVEIMVAITLSIFLLGGVISIFASSKQSYLLQDEMGTLHENERIAMYLLNREIRMAGYSSDDLLDAIAAFDTDNTVNGSGNTSDTIAIRHESTVDCLNHATPTISGVRIAVNRYYIENEQLMCLGNGDATAEAILDGVVNMQILYGMNTDSVTSNTSNIANTYVNASEIAATNWGQVKSVRMAMLFSSNGDVNANNSTRSDALLDAPALSSYDDHRRYHSFTTTITLRNMSL